MLEQSVEDEIQTHNKHLAEEKSSKAAAKENEATTSGDLAGRVAEETQDNVSLKTPQTVNVCS